MPGIISVLLLVESCLSRPGYRGGHHHLKYNQDMAHYQNHPQAALFHGEDIVPREGYPNHNQERSVHPGKVNNANHAATKQGTWKASTTTHNGKIDSVGAWKTEQHSNNKTHTDQNLHTSTGLQKPNSNGKFTGHGKLSEQHQNGNSYNDGLPTIHENSHTDNSWVNKPYDNSKLDIEHLNTNNHNDDRFSDDFGDMHLDPPIQHQDDDYTHWKSDQYGNFNDGRDGNSYVKY